MPENVLINGNIPTTSFLIFFHQKPSPSIIFVSGTPPLNILLNDIEEVIKTFSVARRHVLYLDSDYKIIGNDASFSGPPVKETEPKVPMKFCLIRNFTLALIQPQRSSNQSLFVITVLAMFPTICNIILVTLFAVTTLEYLHYRGTLLCVYSRC